MQSASCMISDVISSDGSSIHPMIFSGAPAATAASSTILAARLVHFLALGWGLMMIPFLVLRQINVLKIAVDVGFVVGITAAISPKGSATVFVPNAGSSSMTPQVCTFLYLL